MPMVHEVAFKFLAFSTTTLVVSLLGHPRSPRCLVPIILAPSKADMSHARPLQGMVLITCAGKHENFSHQGPQPGSVQTQDSVSTTSCPLNSE